MIATKTTKKETTREKTTARKKATGKVAEKAASGEKKSKKHSSSKESPVEPSVSPELRYYMIQGAAYYIAENSGFNGSPIEHWIEAEIQIDNHLNGSDS